MELLGLVLSPCPAPTTHASLCHARELAGRPRSQNHHENNLPSQRYKERNKLPPTRNPIVPTDFHGSMMPDEGHIDGFTRAMEEVNARSRQPLPTNNPIFGYSVHRPPAVMQQGLPAETGSPQWSELGRSESRQSTTSERSSSSKVRMAELQQKIHDER